MSRGSPDLLISATEKYIPNITFLSWFAYIEILQNEQSSCFLRYQNLVHLWKNSTDSEQIC